MLIDGNSIINRAFFAFQNSARLTARSGFPTNAIFGFLNIYYKFLDEIKPTHACVAFDRREPTFRHLKYKEYKATRHGMPDELAAQLPVMKEVLDAMGVARAECPGYEADDILGTFSLMAEEDGFDTVIVTGDRDSLQLVAPRTRVKIPVTRAGKTITEDYDLAAMREKYGVTPELFIDVKGLMGDSSDNIPGVRGIGEKTAYELVRALGGLDGIYADLGNVERKSVREKLESGREIAYLSRWLAVIARDAPCGAGLGDLRLRPPNREELYRLFRELQFQSYIAKLGLAPADGWDSVGADSAGTGGGATAGAGADSTGAGAGAGMAAAAAARAGKAAGAGAETGAGACGGAMAGAGAGGANGMGVGADSISAGADAANGMGAGSTGTCGGATPGAGAGSTGAVDSAGAYAGAGDGAGCAVEGRPIAIVRGQEQIGRMAAALAGAAQVAVFPVFAKRGDFDSELFGAAFWSDAGHAFYMPAGGIGQRELALALLPVFCAGGQQRLGHDVKQLYHWHLKQCGQDAESPRLPEFGFDTMLGGYVADAGAGRYSLTELCLAYLDAEPAPIEGLTGKGRAKIELADIPEEQLARAAAQNASAIMRLAPVLKGIIAENGQEDLYYSVELPLAEVLASMEVYGFSVDMAGLRLFSAELDEKLTALTKEIYALAGEEFNINSTKQLGAILYEKLGLKPVKRTKTGYSTDIGALDDLAGKHGVIEKIIEYRQHAKLKSTYADGLAALVDPSTGRIHTTMNQAVTATGRISSAEPNLQNIPVKLELGREIRRLFVPRDPSWLLLGADYSQIELRVLAHISEDEGMIGAFMRGADIHRSTAAKVFGVQEHEVTKAMRSKAKAVNFGIVYGIGDYSLAKDIGTTRAEAREYIDNYLARYEGVKRYMADSVEEAKRRGYAMTIMNRRRSLPELKSSNFNIRSFGERVAMNTPVQGSAADIIKIAMIRAYRELKKRGLRSRLILQVHDELIIEAPQSELAEAAGLLKDAMENAVALSVPLTADVYCGPNWRDIKNPVGGAPEPPELFEARGQAGTEPAAGGASAATQRPCVIGLTGASGSGKSEAAKILRRLGAAVIDADAVSREATGDAGVLLELVDDLGDWVVGDDGLFDRKTVAQMAFGDRDILNRLTAITHRYIINRIDAMVSDWKKCGGREAGETGEAGKAGEIGEAGRAGETGKAGETGEMPRVPVLVIDAPLPVKRGFLDNADTVWVVACDYELRLKRVLARDGISREQAEARLSAQMRDSDYIKLADLVITNNGEPEELERQIAEGWRGLALR
jgi:DNA polymerase-1